MSLRSTKIFRNPKSSLMIVVQHRKPATNISANYNGQTTFYANDAVMINTGSVFDSCLSAGTAISRIH